jgi:predicted dehydrogenase
MLQVIQPIDGRPTEVLEVPAPTIGPNEVLIANGCSLISAGTERSVIGLAQKSLIGKARARPDQVRRVIEKVRQEGIAGTIRQVRAKLGQPIPLGYSSAGIVLEVGPGVQAFRPGDRVASNGGHAGVVAVGQNLVARVPDGLSFDQACYAVVGAIALQGVRLARLELGSVVGVIGLGLIGQMAASLLKASGCVVLGTDPDEARCELARELGADWAGRDGFAEAVAGRTRGFGADAVLIAASTPSNDPIEQAARVARQKGRVVAVGAVGMDVPRREFYPKELELVVSCSYGPGRYDPIYEDLGFDYPYAHVRWTEQRNIQAILDLMAAGRIDVKRLTTHNFPIDRADEAYALIRSEPGALGVVLNYPEPPSQVSRRVAIPAARAPKATGKDGALGIGFIGAGNFATAVMLPALASMPGLSLRGLCSAGGLSARTGAGRHGFAYACTDADEILNDPEIDAVFQLTRHDLHASMLLSALRAGKHVFVEKPLAIRAEELEVIESYLIETKGAGPLWTVGFNRRFATASKLVREHFQGVGEPITATYRFNAGPIPPEHWSQDEEAGGGRLVGEACHAVDLLTFLIGSPPVRVHAEAVASGSALRVTSDRAALTIRHADGSISTILYTAGGDRAYAKERVELFGGGRVGVIDDFRRVELARGGRTIVRSNRGQDKGHTAEVAAFLKALRTGGPPPIPVTDMLAVSYATLAAVESIRTGIPNDLPTLLTPEVPQGGKPSR